MKLVEALSPHPLETEKPWSMAAFNDMDLPRYGVVHGQEPLLQDLHLCDMVELKNHAMTAKSIAAWYLPQSEHV